MSVPERHLHAVDSLTGEVLPDGCPQCAELAQTLGEAEKDLRAKRGQITRLKNELAEALAVEPEAEQILEVLEFWRKMCKPRASIVVGSERWLKVRDRLREKDAGTKQLCFSVVHLKAAVTGALLSDYHVSKGYLGAETIFRDQSTTEKHIERAIRFKRDTGTSALLLVDELAGTGLVWLAERCSCGHLFISHLRSFPTTEGDKPCAECGCESYDHFAGRVERWQREQGS